MAWRHTQVAPFKRALSDEGLFGLVRPPLLHTAPPLVISEAELRDGFGRLDRALGVLDEQVCMCMLSWTRACACARASS